MKKYIQSAFIAIVAIVLFSAVPSLAKADVAWNTFTNDCANAIQIGDRNQPLTESSNCWGTSVSNVAPGDIIDVRIYYHNTGSNTAASTTTKVIAPTSISSTQSFTGMIHSSVSKSAGVTANMTGAYSLTFKEAKWFPDNSFNSSSLLNGQTGAEVLGSGLSIGDIASWTTCPGSNSFCHAGSVNVAFTVDTPAPTCAITSPLTANPTTVGWKGSSSLSWATSGCTNTSVTLLGGTVISTAPSSSGTSTGTLYPLGTYTYTLTAYSKGMSPLSSTATVTSTSQAIIARGGGFNINNGNPISISGCSLSTFTPTNSTVISGNSTTLNWTSSSGCSSFIVSGGAFGSTGVSATSGVSTGILSTPGTYTYTLIGYNSIGITSAPLTVNVVVSGTGSACSITGFSAYPNSVNSGGQTTLTWTSTNCATFQLSGGGFNLGVPVSSGVTTQALYTTTLFTLYAYASGSTTPVTWPLTVMVNNGSNCTANFYASQTQVLTGAMPTLYWNSNGCTGGVSVYGPNINSSSQWGSQVVGPIYGTNTYTLSAYGSNNVYLTVTISDQFNGNNGNGQGTAPIVTTYAATNTNSSSGTLNGYVNANNFTCSASSYCNSSYATYYFQYGTSQWSLPAQTPSQTLSTNAGNVSATLTNLQANTTYYFRAVSTNGYGTTEGNILSFVTTNGSSGLTAITSVATNVSAHYARLNGLVVAPQNTTGTTTYFEYGTSSSLGEKTNSQTVSNSILTNYFEEVSVSPNTTYYFRIVAMADGQTYSGSTVSFTTPDVTSYTPKFPPKITSGTGGGSSYVSLSITDQSQTVAPSDSINYLINYQNISNGTLNNAILNVILPAGVIFKQSSQGVLTTSNTVAVSVGTLSPNAQGTISIQAVADSNITSGNNLVTTATLSFTNTNGSQDSAVAYVLNTVNNSQSNYAGLAMFGTGFFPNTLMGWIILLGSFSVLVLLARYLYSKTKNSNQPVVSTMNHAHYESPVNSGSNPSHLPH